MNTEDDGETQDILGVTVGKSRPHKNLTYEAFSDAISKKDKTSLLLGASKILWSQWKGEASPKGRENDYYIGRAYLGRVSAIAAGVCQTTNARVAVTDDELLELAGEFLGVTDSVSDVAFFNQQELPRFTKALQDDPDFKSHIPPPEIVRGHAARLTFIRTLRSQWDFKSVDLKGVLRTWNLAQRLDEKYGRGLLDRLRRAMNIELRDQLRAGFAILATGDNTTPGLISERSLLVDADVARTLNLDTDSLALVANRVSRDCASFADWHRGVLSDFPEPYRKYAPHPLVSLPLIQLDASFRGWSASARGFICPSPPHLLWRIQSSCIDAICGLAPEQGKDPRADLGECLSDYIFDFLVLTCGKENVYKLDDISDKSKKHADFVVMAGDVAIVIESKTSLGSALAKSVVSPEDLVEIWSRIYSAYRQCAHTISSDIWTKTPGLSKARKFVSLVCFDEIFCPDGAAFNYYAEHAGLLKSIGLGPAEAISLQNLEMFFATLGAPQLAFLVQAKWYYRRHGDMLEAFISSQTVNQTPPTLEHLRPAAENLLPGINMAKFISLH